MSELFSEACSVLASLGLQHQWKLFSFWHTAKASHDLILQIIFSLLRWGTTVLKASSRRVKHRQVWPLWLHWNQSQGPPQPMLQSTTVKENERIFPYSPFLNHGLISSFTKVSWLVNNFFSLSEYKAEYMGNYSAERITSFLPRWCLSVLAWSWAWNSRNTNDVKRKKITLQYR